jgi:hypothetical protein
MSKLGKSGGESKKKKTIALKIGNASSYHASMASIKC